MMPGSFVGVASTGVRADGSNQISFDASIALGRGDDFVGCLDPIIRLRHLLPHSVVGHQRLYEHGCRQTADRKALQAVHEIPATDFAVNKKVIECDRFARQF